MNELVNKLLSNNYLVVATLLVVGLWIAVVKIGSTRRY
jgi:hypothetical protein